MLSKEDIERGKREALKLPDALHIDDNCIRAVYEWLDAQQKTIHRTNKLSDIKHAVESWCGFYVSKSDVIVAAYLHPEIKGEYPHYNIHGNILEPLPCRLVGFKRDRYTTRSQRLLVQTFFEKVQPSMKRIRYRQWP